MTCIYVFLEYYTGGKSQNIRKITIQISDEIADQDLLNDLAAENFDLGMTDVYSTCGFALFHKIGLKTYITGFSSSLVEFVTIPFGIDNNPSYVPG